MPTRHDDMEVFVIQFIADLYFKMAVIIFEFFFFFFWQAFLKKGDMEAKMLSALLTGVNRAFPYAKGMNKRQFVYSQSLLLLTQSEFMPQACTTSFRFTKQQ